MIDMSFYLNRRCKFFVFVFVFFFCRTKDNLKNSHTPNTPPPQKKKILCYIIGSSLQAKPYLLTGKMTQAYIQMCV